MNPLYLDANGELVNPDYTEEMRARALKALHEKRKGEDLQAMWEAYVLAIFHALQRGPDRPEPTQTLVFRPRGIIKKTPRRKRT